MKDEGELGRRTPRPRKRSVPETMFSPVRHVLNKFLSLLVPRDWSRSTLKDIMNNDTRQNELISTYIECELAKMNTTGVTAALIAGVISSGFDWYNIDDTSWVTRAMWFSGLVLAVASVASSAIHTAAFLRMKCSRDVVKSFTQALGNKRTSDKHWHPHALTPYVLGGPTLHLKLAVLAFVIGLFYELWRAAVAADLKWKSDNLKIAFITTLVGGFVVVNYIFSVLTLVHHSMHVTKDPPEV
ncbi:MAG: hypothetical protein L6R36_003842 [Xanthoria steineri]|nr:MAG: hypothetical protein L6R36_003842 [Xanthoria steineri]